MLLLVDASSLAYRAYHAIPSLKAPDGVAETNAIHGTLNFLARLIADRRPSRIAVAFDDDWRPAFRVAALPSYKTHRLATDPDAEEDEVEPQLPIIAEILGALGVACARCAGLEAEDAIASLARRERGPVEIVTGDRDLFALVRDPRVRVLYTLRGVSELAVVDEAWIRAKYGIPGDRYLDYALLRGDPSDGLPGVRGIGPVTAAGLLRKYGSLDLILAARDLAPHLRARFTAAGEYLEAARRVVPMVDHCPVEGDAAPLPPRPADPKRLVALAARYGVEPAIDRVRVALAATRAP